MSLRKPAVILACAAIAIVLLVSMGSLGPEPIKSQSSFAQPETFTIKPEVTKFTEVSGVLEPSSTQLEPTASVMDVGLDKLSLFLNPAFAISSTQTELSYTVYPSGGYFVLSSYETKIQWSICSQQDVYGAFTQDAHKKIGHIDITNEVLTTWDIGEVGMPLRPVCDNSGNVIFPIHESKIAKLDTQTNTLYWYDFAGSNSNISYPYSMVMGPNNEVYFSADGAVAKFNFDTDTFTRFSSLNSALTFEGAGCKNPMVFDSSGNLYAVSNAKVICKIDFSSNTVTYWNLQSLENSNVYTYYLSLDQNNNIFATIPTHQKVLKLDQSSNLVTTWLVPGIQTGPASIEADSSGNVFFVANDNDLWRLVPATDTFTKWGGFSAYQIELNGENLWVENHTEVWKLT